RAGGGVAPKRRCLVAIWLKIFEVYELSTGLECLNRCLNGVTDFYSSNNRLNNNGFIERFYRPVNPL
ncbi:hypothetical protein, partial [Acetobacter pasteurianus]|uniref:hypothetical protein n=1 Tax=Acetobacter pasteurianus TaxID=438 RepID=UPI001BE02912